MTGKKTLINAFKSILEERPASVTIESLKKEGFTTARPRRSDVVAFAIWQRAAAGDITAARLLLELSDEQIADGVIKIIDDMSEPEL